MYGDMAFMDGLHFSGPARKFLDNLRPSRARGGSVPRTLSQGEKQRIVIPLSYRDNYLQGLRALSRNGNPQALVRVLDFAQAYAAAIDWSDLRTAERMLEATNAFVEPEADMRFEYHDYDARGDTLFQRALTGTAARRSPKGSVCAPV